MSRDDREYVLVVTARRFKRAPWPSKTSEYAKVCGHKEAMAEATKLRQLGAQVSVRWAS